MLSLVLLTNSIDTFYHMRNRTMMGSQHQLIVVLEINEQTKGDHTTHDMHGTQRHGTC
jgi:hypothetical protein